MHGSSFGRQHNFRIQNQFQQSQHNRLLPAALFYGDLSSYKKHCLPYPNALTAEASETLREMIAPVESFFKKIPSGEIDEKHEIPKEILAGLAEMGLFGLQIPQELGGLGLSNTAYARMAEEFVLDPSIAVTL